MQTTINFGGFYESLHDDIVERAKAYEIGAVDDNGEIDGDKLWEVDKAEWDSIKEEYSGEWLDMLNQELETDIKFVSLNSPRFYNYSTDVIVGDISQKDALKIFGYVRDNDLKCEVLQAVRDASTSGSGYSALYDYEDYFMREYRALLLQVVLDVIIAACDERYPFIVEDFGC